MSDEQADPWKRCSSCKAAISFGATYYVCSVSTCNKKRGGFFFCSVDCWDEHVPMMRHRDAWAVEEEAPPRGQASSEPEGKAGASSEPRGGSGPSVAPVRRRITVGSMAEPAPPDVPHEVLVVTSRLKNYVRARFGMNTSDTVLDVLSDELRRLADRAARIAREDGRKTVLERDFDFLRKSRNA